MIAACLFLACSTAGADERVFLFESEIEVKEDASLLVKETITVWSEGQKIIHGIYRDFPTDYRPAFGLHRTVGFEVIEVKRDGMNEPYHLGSFSNGRRVYMGSKDALLQPGTHTYTLVYRTDRQLGFFDGRDELYWNVNGTGWDLPIDRVSAKVRLPGAAWGRVISVEAYTGTEGEKGADYLAEKTLEGASFRSTRTLQPRECLTIVVTWPQGAVARPEPSERMQLAASANIGLVLSALGLIGILVYYLIVWVMAGRDPEAGVIVVRYEPPDRMTPCVMRYARRMGYDDRTFAAAVLDMAVKGRLVISKDSGVYTLKKQDTGQGQLDPEEEKAMKALFESADEVSLQKANHLTISKAIADLRNELRLRYEKLYFVTNRGYFVFGLIMSALAVFAAGAGEAAGTERLAIFLFMSVWLTGWSFGVFVLFSQVFLRWRMVLRYRSGRAAATAGAIGITVFSVPFLVGEVFGLVMFATATSVFVLIFFLTVLFLNVLFYRLLKAPTRAGRRLLDAIEGFRMFLVATEQDRMNMMNPPDRTPALFERYLPYALALDAEQEWSDQFSEVLSEAAAAPQEQTSTLWYTGTDLQGVSTSDFGSTFGDSLSGAIASSSSAPGSGSGSGGGGSSGGGGGGGGGGGW